MPSYDNKVLTGDQLVYYSGLIKTELNKKLDADRAPTVSDIIGGLAFGTAYDGTNNPIATMNDIGDSIGGITISDITTGEVDPETDSDIYLNDYLAQIEDTIDHNYTNLRDSKQDALVFNTAYDAVRNKVATMADIPTTTEYTADLSQTMGSGVSITSSLTAMDGISSAISNNSNELYKLTVSAFGMKGYDNVNSQEVNVGISDFIWKDNANSKQISLTPGSNYDGLYVNGNKVATVADVNTAIGGVSSFSFEIVNSLPATGNSSKIYLVAKSSSGTNQVYTEYIYVNDAWEIIGDTQMTIDTLSNAEVQTIWNAASAT